MTPRRMTVRNAAALAGTGGLMAWLLSYPTSTGAGRPGEGAPGGAAPVASVVVEPAGDVLATGPAVPTEYGPVRVLARLRSGRLVATRALDHPRANIVDQAINADALPQLAASALRHQDGEVDTVTNATATSEGYQRSLQAALDAAHAAR